MRVKRRRAQQLYPLYQLVPNVAIPQQNDAASVDGRASAVTYVPMAHTHGLDPL